MMLTTLAFCEFEQQLAYQARLTRRAPETPLRVSESHVSMVTISEHHNH